MQGERELEYKTLQQELQSVDQESRRNASCQQERLVQLGKLQSEEEQYKNRVKERDYLLNNLAHRYQWSGHSSYPSDQPLSNKLVDVSSKFINNFCNLVYRFVSSRSVPKFVETNI